MEPEYRFKNWTVSGTFGANFGRTDRYRDREPSNFLKWGNATFDPSFYISAGINITLQKNITKKYSNYFYKQN